MDYYTDYQFTSNVTNYACPRNGNTTEHKCEPPNACAREPTQGRWYCCDYNGEQCWTGTSKCTNDSDDLRCSGSTRKSALWCCSYELETCTSQDKQINICWNKQQSPLRNISSQALNKTYSSLSAASPAATTWSFDPKSLIPVTSTPSPTPVANTSSSSASLSGGAIAGIVVGVVAGVAIALGAAAFFLKRHRQRQNSVPEPPPPGPYPAELANEPKERFEADGNGIQELPASHTWEVELEGSDIAHPVGERL